MGWRVLIVDDEEPAREELAYMLEENKEIDLIVQASTGMDAIKKVKVHEPDLIFLDINLPDLSGLQVAEIVNELGVDAKVIFLTAYDQYAIDAFKLRAFHYILKPYDEEDLALVFDELEKKIKKTAAVTPSPAGSPMRLAIETEGGIKYLSPKDILYISKKKEEKHVSVHAKDKTYEAPHTLMELEKKLAPHNFFRVHKSFLVNLEYVAELRSFFHGTYNLHLADTAQTVVPVSRNYVKELRAKLEL